MGFVADSVCKDTGDAADDNTTSVPFDRYRSRLLWHFFYYGDTN